MCLRWRESYGRHGLARSGRVVGSREGDSSSTAAGLVAVASANPGGCGHCEWPSVVTGRATRGGERRNTAVSGHRIRAVHLGWPLGPVRARWARLLALARSAPRRLGGSVAWRLVGSPAQWERPRNQSHVAVRDRTTKPSWGSDAQAGLMWIPAFSPEEVSLKKVIIKKNGPRPGAGGVVVIDVDYHQPKPVQPRPRSVPHTGGAIERHRAPRRPAGARRASAPL